jgi:hypothetical protein
MGYTHYWKLKHSVDNEENIIKACAEFKHLLEKLNIQVIYSSNRTQEPIINSKQIIFDGINSPDEACVEGFSIDFLNDVKKFNFCKTNRDYSESNAKYDKAVCLALVCLANNIIDFHFTSDGDFSDWKEVFTIYETFFGQLKFLMSQLEVGGFSYAQPLMPGLDARVTENGQQYFVYKDTH